MAIIDELKVLAIFLVVVYHSLGFLGFPNYFQGQVGVDIFLMVSGFTLALSSVDISVREFLKKRFLRIYPPYWIAIGVFVLLDFFIFHVQWNYQLKTIVAHIAGIQTFLLGYYPYGIDGSWWFISLIIFCYLIFLCVRKKIGNTSLMICICSILIALLSITYHALGTDPSSKEILMAYLLPDFFLGMIAGQFYKNGTLEIKPNITLVTGLVFISCVVFSNLGNAYFVLGTYQLAAAAYILFWWVIHKLLLKTKCGEKLLTSIGSLSLVSYEIYLFHEPLTQTFNIWVYNFLGILNPTRLELAYGVFIGFCVTFLIAIGVHILMDKLFKNNSKDLNFLQP